MENEDVENYEDMPKRLNDVYLSIINRYKDYISNEESISVAELPRLVTPRDQNVSKKTKEIMDSFGVYDYERHFYEASVMAYDYVRENIKPITLPVEFWLEPSDTMEFGAGEKLDRYILLCSLIIALGNPSSKIVIMEKNDRLRPLLYYEFNGIYVMEFETEIKKFENKTEMLNFIGIKEDITAYEFNDKMYVDIA